MSKIQSIKTSDGYVFFSNGNGQHGWYDSINLNGEPYQVDMVIEDELVNEWIADGFAELFEWELFWTPVYEGPFDSEQEAIDYRDTEVNRVMPTRIRSMKTKTGDNMWLIDCRREVSA